jgi:hypothetical protein
MFSFSDVFSSDIDLTNLYLQTVSTLCNRMRVHLNSHIGRFIRPATCVNSWRSTQLELDGQSEMKRGKYRRFENYKQSET